MSRAAKKPMGFGQTGPSARKHTAIMPRRTLRQKKVHSLLTAFSQFHYSHKKYISRRARLRRRFIRRLDALEAHIHFPHHSGRTSSGSSSSSSRSSSISESSTDGSGSSFSSVTSDSAFDFSDTSSSTSIGSFSDDEDDELPALLPFGDDPSDDSDSDSEESDSGLDSEESGILGDVEDWDMEDWDDGVGDFPAASIQARIARAVRQDISEMYSSRYEVSELHSVSISIYISFL